MKLIINRLSNIFPTFIHDPHRKYWVEFYRNGIFVDQTFIDNFSDCPRNPRNFFH